MLVLYALEMRTHDGALIGVGILCAVLLVQEGRGVDMSSPPGRITKTYPERGPIQQDRFDEVLSINCFRCGQNKKSKLIAIYRGDWDHILCNGCYGRLLSIYEIQAGTSDDDAKAGSVAELLPSTVAQADIRAAIESMHVAEHRSRSLSGEALKFLATAEDVAGTFRADPAIVWYPAVIGLCKA